MKTKAKKVLDSARAVALSSATWADLSNALFDPIEGLVAKAYPHRDEREKFIQTGEYKAIRQLVDAAEERTGLVEGATPRKSGKFMVRLPRSLHAALDAEADQEGVSLNQLVVTKLAAQLSRLANSATPEMALIAQAYLEVRHGYSIDRVVADPDLDRRFLQRCREIGLTGTDFDLNWKLFNGRKNTYFADLPRTRNYTASRKDEFEFSSEMAIRYVQERVRTHEHRDVALDRIICDPDLAAEFDKVADRLAPGFSPLEYRWVALGVRKAAGRYSRKAKTINFPNFEFLGTTTSVRPSKIPTDQGMYFFRCGDKPLFIGETANLRQRIAKHFESGGSTGIPDWLYHSPDNAISLGVVATPMVSPTDRKIIELGAIHAFHPFFNYCGSRAA